jgi:hypothetical protein
MSVMCSSPSMPPRSTNAPKSAMFLTVPVRAALLDLAHQLGLRLGPLLSISLRRLMTMLRRSVSILRISASTSWPMNSPMSCRTADVDLRGGQEDRHADIDEQAALDLQIRRPMRLRRLHQRRQCCGSACDLPCVCFVPQ